MFDLTGRTALVTGASRGLGERFALTRAKAGAALIVTSRTLASLEKITAEIEALGRKCTPLVLDVSSFESIKDAIATVKTKVPKIDILVNNAGCNVRKPATEITWEDWNLVLDTNLRAFERAGLVRILAEPNLTSVNGENAEFLDHML